MVKGVKRQGSSPPRVARKKTNADPVKSKLKEVVHAIDQADALSDSCKEMLNGVVSSTLSIFATERHPYQVQAVEMVRETLAGVEAQMQKAAAAAQAQVDNAESDKAARAAALASAQAIATDLEAKDTAAKTAVDDDKAGLAAAKGNVATAQASVGGKDAEVEKLAEQKAKLEAALKDLWEPMKTAKAKKHPLNHLEKVFRDAHLEAGLIDSVAESMLKDPEDRGTFDGIVVRAVDQQSAQFIAKAENSLKDAEADKASCIAAKTAADEAFAAAEEKLAASNTAHAHAHSASKEGHDALKAAEKAMTGFERDMKGAGGSLEDAKADLESFTEGALKSFAALKDLAPPPAPEPEVVEAAVEEAEAPEAQEPVAVSS